LHSLGLDCTPSNVIQGFKGARFLLYVLHFIPTGERFDSISRHDYLPSVSAHVRMSLSVFSEHAFRLFRGHIFKEHNPQLNISLWPFCPFAESGLPHFRLQFVKQGDFTDPPDVIPES
jgi:hypothetical protein